MDKAPLLCRIKSNIIRKSPSAIMAGCNFGIFPSGKCIDCPEYNAWWEEFEWSILKMVELKPEQIKAAEAVLAKGRCVEIRPTKDGVKVLEVIRIKQKSSENRSDRLSVGGEDPSVGNL